MSVTTQSARIERNATEVCRAALETVSDGVLVVGPSAAVVEGVLAVLAERNDPPSIDVLAPESVLKEFTADFTDASTLADFVAAGSLALRTTDERLDGPLLLTDESVISVVSAGGRTASLSTDETEFVGTAWERYSARWDDAEAFKLRTPPLSRVRETMDEKFGEAMTADFEAMRAALETDDELDEVDICLLAAAENEVLLYDVSTWGETVGVASRATFSRKKTQLEEAGLIATEKVPIDVGRPRLRLLLGDDRLRETDDVVGTAREIIAGIGP